MAGTSPAMTTLNRRSRRPPVSDAIALPSRGRWLNHLTRKPVALAANLARRGRGEMCRAADCIGVAIAFEETATRLGGELRIDVEPWRQLRMERLQGRMHEVAGEDRILLARSSEGEGDMARRVAWRRQEPHMIADRVIVGHDLRLLGLDHRQHAVGNGRHLAFCVLLGPVIVLGLAEDVARLWEGRHPAP